MKKLIDRLRPQVLDMLFEREVDFPATTGELIEKLEKEDFWSQLDYYLVRRLCWIVYGEGSCITDSKIEILFDDEQE